MSSILADIREYVFPLFLADDPAGRSPGEAIVVRREDFLGTAFFVSRNGIALTAGHCTPDPAGLPSGKALVAAVWDGQRAQAKPVQLATILDSQDLALLKIAHAPAKYLRLAFEQVLMGDDVSTVGIPSHSVSGEAFEYRYLKGHVTFISNTLELNFAAPRGMSGSPVMKDDEVVGVLSWNARAESLEDRSEEHVETIGPITRITRTVTMAVTNYGQAEPIRALETAVFPLADGLALPELLAKMNLPE